MSRGSWVIYKKVGDSWTDDGTIYPPNEDLTTPEASTQTKISLADGDRGFITPSTKYNKEPITLTWYWVDATFKGKIKTYFRDGTSLKIVDDKSVEYVGRIISYQETRLVGESEDLYDLQTVFEAMPGLA